MKLPSDVAFRAFGLMQGPMHTDGLGPGPTPASTPTQTAPVTPPVASNNMANPIRRVIPPRTPGGSPPPGEDTESEDFNSPTYPIYNTDGGAPTVHYIGPPPQPAQNQLQPRNIMVSLGTWCKFPVSLTVPAAQDEHAQTVANMIHQHTADTTFDTVNRMVPAGTH